jgi:hypothetical protein
MYGVGERSLGNISPNSKLDPTRSKRSSTRFLIYDYSKCVDLVLPE